MNDRDEIARIIRDNILSLALSSHPRTSEKVADQILALLEPQMLTKIEARALAQCFAGEYGKIPIMNEKSPLCLKLKKIAEGQ